MALTIDDSNFESTILNQGVALVDFWAPWCGPCRALAPYIEQLAAEYEGRAVVGKVNADEVSELPMKYGVRNLPTILFFKNGEVVDKQVGGTTKAALQQKLDALL